MTKRFQHGLIVGKFYPLHAGHSQLIRSALTSCDQLTIQVIASSVETIPVEVRVQWIQEEHPTATVKWVVDDGDDNFSNEAAWKHYLAVIGGLLDAPVDAVFTSDLYGEELSRRLKARWVRVDPERRGNPVSGSAIRTDPERYWWALSATVRQYLTQRIVVLGAESTGSTTLVTQLAKQFGVPWVAEFGHEWAEIRPGGQWAPWHAAEFEFIAREQLHTEAAALRLSPKPLLICDSDLIGAALWQERQLGTGERSRTLLKKAANQPPLLYLLASDEVPVVYGERPDGEKARRRLQQRFREVLGYQSVPWLEVRGNEIERLAAASAAVEKAMSNAFKFHPGRKQYQLPLQAHLQSGIRAAG